MLDFLVRGYTSALPGNLGQGPLVFGESEFEQIIVPN
jgi:hypothetical protein